MCYLVAWMLADRVELNYWLDRLFTLFFPINSLRDSNRMVLIRFDSLPTPPRPTLLPHTCNCVSSFIFEPNESNLCCSFTLGCVALQGSMVNLPRAIPLMKTDSSSTELLRRGSNDHLLPDQWFLAHRFTIDFTINSTIRTS